MTINYTGSGYTPIQAGRIVPHSDDHNEQADRTPPAQVEVRNARRGNATVGEQHDTFTGGFTVVSRGR